jgi:alkaline phosphatase D
MQRNQQTRRQLMKRALALAGVSIAGAYLNACTSTPLSARRITFHPFALGVASGDPVSDGFVIWTRLTPQGAITDEVAETLDVVWEVATDEKMGNVVQSGTVQALPALGHAVHVEVRGLPAGRPYWYRFRLPMGDASATGRTWTAPVLGSALERLRFAFASCQHYEQGYFTAYDLMAKDDVDLVMHLGDYIYESSWGDTVRRHDGPEPKSLPEYRNRHALYKSDKGLQGAHARTPWLVTWDDHEVDNDYQAFESEDYQVQAEFVKRRAAAYQAYYEHMPLRRVARPRGDTMQLFQRSQFGDLMQFTMIDNRQYRSPAACRTPERGGGQVVSVTACKELFEEERSMLGKDQERWLSSALSRSSAKWNIIGNGEMFSRLRQKTSKGEEGHWTDDWNGYPSARQRLISTIARSKVSNPVFVTGDIHSFWVNDVKEDFAREQSATIATEIVGTSISSAGVSYDTFSALLPQNPHVRFFESRHRGYVLCTADANRMEVELKIVDTVREPASGGKTLATFVIESGKAGAVRA